MSKLFPCPLCERMTRPDGTTIAQHPGTIIRYGGMCKTCHQHNPPQLPGRHTPEHNKAGLISYLTRRRQREAAMTRYQHYLDRIAA